MKCSVKECNNEAKHKFGGDGEQYCSKHLHHMYRHGRIIEHHRRSSLDWYVENNNAYIKLYDNNGYHVATTILDIEDIEKVKNYRCSLNNDGYVRINNKFLTLHRFIMDEVDTSFQIDHINGNTLDNRKSNLRVVTNQQNQFNEKNEGQGNNNRKGVSFRKDRNRWRAYITIDGKQINLGSFLSEEEAIKAREEAEIKYFGEYRRKE